MGLNDGRVLDLRSIREATSDDGLLHARRLFEKYARETSPYRANPVNGAVFLELELEAGDGDS